MSAPTPGPWRVVEDGDARKEGDEEHERRDKYASVCILGVGGEEVCSWVVDHYELCWDSVIPTPADTRLMAAAPDLLAACEAFLGVSVPHVDLNVAAKMAREAVAKARGTK